MSQSEAEFWVKARQARDKLAAQLLGQPAVSLIDLGYDPEDPASPKRIVLRVHLRQARARQTLELPQEIDGIPVRTIIGDYQLE